MNAAESTVHADHVADLLRSLRVKGVHLWSEGGRLHYKAPKGALSREEVHRLQAMRGPILVFLQKSAVAFGEPEIQPRLRRDRAPLSFSQLAHLNLMRFHGEEYRGRSMRLVWSATRLCGTLNIEILDRSLHEMVRRHEPLRTRIISCDGALMQDIAESCKWQLEFCDLTAVPMTSHEKEIERHIDELVLHPIDMDEWPLFGLRLLRLRPEEHVLIVALDHLISDGTSINIVLRDILDVYMQIATDRSINLPPIGMQFADYAQWQRCVEPFWVQAHGEHWKARLLQHARLSFPEDGTAESEVGWGAVPFAVGKTLKAELKEWCRERHTSLVMSVLTAYVAFVLRWCNAEEGLIQYAHNGRVSPKIEQSVGYFASVLYLHSRLAASDSFIDLLAHVVEEYCAAHEHADSFYMAAHTPEAQFARNTLFNWSPLGTQIELRDSGVRSVPITWEPIRVADPVRKKLAIDHDPLVRLCDATDEIGGYVFFPSSRFSQALMERFTQNFVRFIEALVRTPNQRVRDVRIV